MNNLLLTAVLVVLTASCGFLWYLYRLISFHLGHFWEEIDSIHSFVSAPDDKTPSPLAQTIEAIGKIMGRSIAMEVKTTLMGKASAESRILSAVEGDLANDNVQSKMPFIAELLNASPSLGKRARKSPMLMDMLIKYGPGLMGRFGSGNGSSSSHSPDVKFQL